MARIQFAIAVTASSLALLGSGAAALATVVAHVPAKTGSDVRSLLAHERALAATLSRYPGAASPRLPSWEASYRSELAAQSAAAGTVTTDLASSVAVSGSRATYEARATTMSYAALTKDPAALKGRVVTFHAQVFQYDTNTGTKHFLASVTNDGYGVWTDNVWADVNPEVAAHVCDNTVIQFWGSVVGAYTYTTTNNGNATVPEIRIKYLTVLSHGC